MASNAKEEGTKRGDPSPIFNVCDQSHKVDKLTNKCKKTESIIHRLNNLSVLINSSYIDLNIAFHESGEGSSNDRPKSSHYLRTTISKENGTPLKSLASQSTKRRSILPKEKIELDVSTTVSDKPANCAYIARDGLIDAFLTLYEECQTNEQYKKDPLIKAFVNKCKYH